MDRIYDILTILTISLLNLAFLTAYEVSRGGDVYTYIFLPAIISGFIVSVYSQDIRKILILDIVSIAIIVILSSLLSSLPAFIGVIPEDVINPFIFISIKKSLNNSILLILPLIVSTLVFSTVISGLKGE